MRKLVLAALAVALGGACEGEHKNAEAAVAGKMAADTAAGALCEHGVQRAICTKCNPKLIPVFQAKGDWCEEHGFPESVCPICHPERGGKPAADVSSDGAPADGTKVRFKTKDTARLAGLETVKAELRSSQSGLRVTVKIEYDATRVALVNARASGVVRAIKADIGTRVMRGGPLAAIQSAALGADQSRLEAVRIRVRITEAHYQREKELNEKGISATKDVLGAQDEWEKAKADLAALDASLGIVGSGPGTAGDYTLTAPIGGVVTQRNVTVGNLVGVDQPLFQIVDTSTMWAELDVPEGDLPRVAVGQGVMLVLDGLGEREFAGPIAYVAPEIDARTRTARARVPLVNPDGLLRANQFGQARIAVSGSYETVVVPRAALQRAKGVHIVFVRLAQDEYEARRVQKGATEGVLVEITKGLRPGEEIVTQGSFLLKTETLKESIGAGCCDVD